MRARFAEAFVEGGELVLAVADLGEEDGAGGGRCFEGELGEFVDLGAELFGLAFELRELVLVFGEARGHSAADFSEHGGEIGVGEDFAANPVEDGGVHDIDIAAKGGGTNGTSAVATAAAGVDFDRAMAGAVAIDDGERAAADGAAEDAGEQVMRGTPAAFVGAALGFDFRLDGTPKLLGDDAELRRVGDDEIEVVLFGAGLRASLVGLVDVAPFDAADVERAAEHGVNAARSPGADAVRAGARWRDFALVQGFGDGAEAFARGVTLEDFANDGGLGLVDEANAAGAFGGRGAAITVDGAARDEAATGFAFGGFAGTARDFAALAFGGEAAHDGDEPARLAIEDHLVAGRVEEDLHAGIGQFLGEGRDAKHVATEAGVIADDEHVELAGERGLA